MADACPALAGEDVGKSAAPVPDVPALAASSCQFATAVVQASAAAPCTPAAVQFAEQSCAAQVSSVAAGPQRQEARAHQVWLRWRAAHWPLPAHWGAVQRAPQPQRAAEPQARLPLLAALPEMSLWQPAESCSSARAVASAEPEAE
jgi:hypothetical protein